MADALQRKFDTGVGGLEGHCKDLESELAATRRALEEVAWVGNTD